MTTIAAAPHPKAVINPGWASAAVALLFVLATVLAWSLAPGWNWIAVVVVLAGAVAVIGRAATGRALGILINERNVMSLSRLQTTIWTILVVSAYLVIALARVRSEHVAEPLLVAIDWQVWALLGISATALVGTPLIYSGKQRRTVGEDELKKVREAVARKEGEAEAKKMQNEGTLWAYPSPADASLMDVFYGDEIANGAFIDLTKLQMFFFTLVVAIAYAVQLFNYISFSDLAASDAALPALPDGILALLGISNAGYLASKPIDRTPSTP